MLQDDETSNNLVSQCLTPQIEEHKPRVQCRRVTEDSLESVEGFGALNKSSGDLPICRSMNILSTMIATQKVHTEGVERTSCRRTRPENGNHAHCQRNSSNTVIYKYEHPIRKSSLGRIESHVPMSPNGGRMVVGVTPRTVLMALRVQPNSATTCSVVREVKGCDGLVMGHGMEETASYPM